MLTAVSSLSPVNIHNTMPEGDGVARGGRGGERVLIVGGDEKVSRERVVLSGEDVLELVLLRGCDIPARARSAITSGTSSCSRSSMAVMPNNSMSTSIAQPTTAS